MTRTEYASTHDGLVQKVDLLERTMLRRAEENSVRIAAIEQRTKGVAMAWGALVGVIAVVATVVGLIEVFVR